MIKGNLDVSGESDKVSYKRPGPRLSACQWCGKVTCNHCRCTGQNNCHHAPGEMCKNQRYKRRLVCNPCEKNKLKNRQLYQQRLDKKGISPTPAQGVYSDSLLPGLDPSRVKGTQGYSTSLKIQCPNVAVLFYKTQQVLTMIPITAFQNTLSQIRKLISSMKLFIDDTKFIFIHENVIINFDDESKIAAMSILREYAFPYPINCNRCIIIHIRPPVPPKPSPQPQMVPMNVIPQQMGPVWSQSFYAPSASSQQPVPSKSLSDDSLNPSTPVDPSSASVLPGKIPNLIENPDLPKSGLFQHLSRDSAQWFLSPSEIMMNQGGSFAMDMRPSFSQGYLPSEGHPLGFRDEGLSGEFISGLSPAPRNASYGDMSFLLPFHGNAVARRASESEFNWPVFAKRPEMAGEGEETPLYASELGHSLETEQRGSGFSVEQRGSTLSAEDMQLSSVLSGLKRDRGISERREGGANDAMTGSVKEAAPAVENGASGGQINSDVV